MMERSRVSNSTLLFAGLSLALVVLFVYFNSPIRSFVHGVFVSLRANQPVSGEYESYSRSALLTALYAQNEELSRIRYQGMLFGTLAKENEALRATLGARLQGASHTGRVIMRPPNGGYDTLSIDLGIADGIKENNLVVFSGVALGTISSLSERSARVTLFSSPGTSYDVIIGTPPAVVVAIGLGAGAFELSVPQGVKVSPGDVVRFSASESLMLGVVKNVSSEERDILQTVHFSIPVSFSELDFVSVLSE